METEENLNEILERNAHAEEENDALSEINVGTSDGIDSSIISDGEFVENVVNYLPRPTPSEAHVEVPVNSESADKLSPKLLKIPFKLKFCKNGNILTVHHTVQEGNKIIRIRVAVCCFSDKSTRFIIIDKRGNIFVFDLATKRYWKQPYLIKRASVIIYYGNQNKEFLIGTKFGELYHIDAEKNTPISSRKLSDAPIKDISVPGLKAQSKRLILLHFNQEAILFNLDSFKTTHRLDIPFPAMSLKFASFLPQSEQIITCFVNDVIYVWSAVSLNTLKFFHPIKTRDHKLRLMPDKKSVPVFALEPQINKQEFELKCQDRDYTLGSIFGHCFSPDGRLICLYTIDNYLMLLSTSTFEIEDIFYLNDFILKDCVFLPYDKNSTMLGLTTEGHLVLLDFKNILLKVIMSYCAVRMNLSNNGKLLAVISNCGEVDVWSTCRVYNTLKSQEQCKAQLKTALHQSKPLKLGASSRADAYLTEEITTLLKPERLLNILREYGCYPAKYRLLIWCSLLKLPNNREQFQVLLKMEVPAEIKLRAQKLKLKNEAGRTALVKIWSCLSHWCKVFAYSSFLPSLIFPFVKLFVKNVLIAFEICATLLLNHFQSWFEFHPLHPSSYLGICENILDYYDREMSKFYDSVNIGTEQYAWSLLSTAFSEVLDEDEWLCLWDNIISCSPYFVIFCVVAYNIYHREIIIRLPDKEAIEQFFYEQNPVDMSKMISKAHSLMSNCPITLHPRRYISDFKPIPKNVYPKFLNYPRKLVARHEQEVTALQEEHREIEKRIREVELEEMKMVAQLENGLREEEHAKRVKEMEKLYRDTLKQEEDRVACQRKLLLLYQKEFRNKKAEMLAALKDSEWRKKAVLMERELEALRHKVERERLRNDTKLVLAEDNLRNQEVDQLANRMFSDLPMPLTAKFRDDIRKYKTERKLLDNAFKKFSEEIGKKCACALSEQQTSVDDIERQINEIQVEFLNLTKAKK